MRGMVCSMSEATAEQLAELETLAALHRHEWPAQSYNGSVRRGEKVSADLAGVLIRELKRFKASQEPVAPGIYLRDGIVYCVQRSQTGRGYAKSLDAPGVYTYAPGVAAQLKPEHSMTLAQAKVYGVIHGVCARCGRALTDAKSVQVGIGPVCAKYFAG